MAAVDENTEKTSLVPDSRSESKATDRQLDKVPNGVMETAKGITALFGSVLLVSISRVCVQMLEGAVPDFELNTIRCGFSLVFFMFYFIATQSLPWIKREHIGTVFLISLFNNLVTLGLRDYVANSNI